MVMEDEKLTGALGPEWTRGRTDCRLLDEDMMFVRQVDNGYVGGKDERRSERRELRDNLSQR